MHEVEIVGKIVKEAKKAGASKSIVVNVGELCEITAKEVEDTLRKLVDWNIKINNVKSKVKCSCGYVGSAKIVDRGHGYCYFRCPECNKNPIVLEGGEIKIAGVE